MSFRESMKDRVTLVKQDGTRFENIQAAVQPNMVFIDDPKLPIEEGDRFHRALPNGLTEVYLVLDRGFYSGIGGISDHYQARVRKETSLPRRQAGPTIYNISGPNARVNINSVDLSANVIDLTSDALFQELRAAITNGIADAARREVVLSAVGSMEVEQGKKTFAARYREFVAVAADHMALIGPFIPALTQLLR
jgi:hypothetical protein